MSSLALAASAPAYRRHRPEQTALYAVVAEHYPRFLQSIEASGGHLPAFVRQEFEDYLKCGLLDHGFLRVKCDGCRHEHLVAFSCKRRGFCPSCGARRMIESAAHLVDHVFPEAPVRQLVLTFPFPLRLLLAAEPRVLSEVLAVVQPRHLDLSDSSLRAYRGIWGQDGRGDSDPTIRLGAQPQPAPRQLLLRCSTSCIPAVVHMLFLDGAYTFRGSRPWQRSRLERLCRYITRPPTR